MMNKNPLKQWLTHVVGISAKTPYSGIASNSDEFLLHASLWRILKRYGHKWLKLWTGRQLNLQQSHLPVDAKILWIYNAKPNFGDALMDLSGRSLLQGRASQMDLLIHPNLVSIFQDEVIFRQVYTDVAVCSVNDYDYIVLNEFNYKSIRTKVRYFKNLPFASLYGYFAGPDFNRIAFSFAAINDVFQLNLDADRLLSVAKPCLQSKSKFAGLGQSLLPASPFLTLAVGGIDPNRTYAHWVQVLRLIDASLKLNFPRAVVLLGSENGLTSEAEILQQHFPHIQVVSFVNRVSLLQCRSIIEQSCLFVGADGGLMHVAHSTVTPSVTLFAVGERPSFRLTPACSSTGLQSVGTVSDVDPEEVFRAIHEKMA